MPCDGVVVARTRLKERNRQLQQALQQLRAAGVSVPEIDLSKPIRMTLPATEKQPIPVQLSIDLAGRVTAITTTGTYEQGQKLFRFLFALLQSKGLRIDEPTFESHRHDRAQQLQAQATYNLPGML